MKNGFKVIDSDMHIMEPLDLWDKYMDARFKDRGPRPVRVPTRRSQSPHDRRQRAAPEQSNAGA
jgi:hypothetical protein